MYKEKGTAIQKYRHKTKRHNFMTEMISVFNCVFLNVFSDSDSVVKSVQDRRRRYGQVILNAMKTWS